MIQRDLIPPILRDIADKEILTSLFMDDYSLMNGQMGVAIFFALLSKASENHWYEEFADELLENVCNNLSSQLPIDFAHGLCGIGWGIEFLKYRGFIENDTDDILSEIDAAVMERDVRRINDASLETGLQGICAYVYARINSRRKTSPNSIFDEKYIEELHAAMARNNIADIHSLYSLDSVWMRYLEMVQPTGDKKGWQYGVRMLESDCVLSFEQDKHSIICMRSFLDTSSAAGKTSVFVFTSDCAGGRYGMGTYVNNLIKCIDKTRFDVIVVTLNASDLIFEITDGVAYLGIPKIGLCTDYNSKQKYDRACFFYIAEKIGINKKIVCHFNLYDNPLLCRLMKEKIDANTVFTVHFTNWGINFNGNAGLISEIQLKSKDDLTPVELSALEQFQAEKSTLAECNHIIVPAKHSVENLKHIYGISTDRIHLLPHYLESPPSISGSKSELRDKYEFKHSDKIVLFVGRLDANKGVFDLMKAIKPLMRDDHNINLLIAGDGFFNELCLCLAPYWSRIRCVGFQSRQVISELMSLSDLGVVPSHYEEFGYVAREMVVAGLPVLVADCGGLRDVAESCTSVYTFCYDNVGSLTFMLDKMLHRINLKNIRNNKKAMAMYINDHSNFANRMSSIYTCKDV